MCTYTLIWANIKFQLNFANYFMLINTKLRRLIKKKLFSWERRHPCLLSARARILRLLIYDPKFDDNFRAEATLSRQGYPRSQR